MLPQAPQPTAILEHVNTAPEAGVDPAEIDKFDAIAHRFWDPEGEFRPLHRLNPVRADYVAGRTTLAGRRVVDVGCGGGLLAEALTRRGAQVTAIDRAPGMIRIARLHAAESGLAIDYRLQDAGQLLADPAARFDVVCCMEMLEHVPDPAGVLAQLGQLLRPGGDLFVSTLNRTPQAFAKAIVGAEYLMRLLPRGTHEYDRFIRPAELAAWARNAGLALVHTAGLDYEPFGGAARLSTDTSVNYVAQLRREDA
jgi:2-polyprenyl-6-hydroxyphenyl methylase / 3-demethylubiquinone-9 3-methyltransferase